MKDEIWAPVFRHEETNTEIVAGFAPPDDNPEHVLSTPKEIEDYCEQKKYPLLKLGYKFDRLTRFPRKAIEYSAQKPYKMRKSKAPKVEGWEFTLPKDDTLAGYLRKIPEVEFPWDELKGLNLKARKTSPNRKSRDKPSIPPELKKLLGKLKEGAVHRSSLGGFGFNPKEDDPFEMEFTILNTIYDDILNHGDPPLHLFERYWDLFQYYTEHVGTSIVDQYEKDGLTPEVYASGMSYKSIPQIGRYDIPGFEYVRSVWIVGKQYNDDVQPTYREFWMNCKDMDPNMYAGNESDVMNILKQFDGEYLGITNANTLAVELSIFKKV